MDRRRFFRAAAAAGMGVAGVGVAGAVPLAGTALAAPGGAGPVTPGAAEPADAQPSDAAVLNFALNLEYLEAEFYLRAVTGQGLAANQIDGLGRTGGVVGGHPVPFRTPAIRQYAEEIAQDERAHVDFLRSALGAARVSRPAIDLRDSFTAAARAAGLVGPGGTFDPFADENSFLLGAFVFEDVGVTAYKGAAPLIQNKTYLEAAAGILAVEAYHAATIRVNLLARGLAEQAGKISDARDALDGSREDDQGIVLAGRPNVVPADGNGLAFSRSAAQVLNVVYLTPEGAATGGFFPGGMNGDISTSGAAAA